MRFATLHALTKPRARALIAAVMVLAFAVRSLVPQGFMPSSARPFSVDICPEGLPAQLLGLVHVHDGAAHHHGAGHWHTEHCVFGCAYLDGPLSHHPPIVPGVAAKILADPSIVATAAIVRLVHLPEARGPPPAV
jgi:hypothetical protein